MKYEFGNGTNAVGLCRVDGETIVPAVYDAIFQRRDEFREALEEADFWLSGALKCKEWVWDSDQREAAESTLEKIRSLTSS